MPSVSTAIGTLCFPALFEPRRNQQNPTQGPRFSLILLFDSLAVQSSAHMELRKAVAAEIANKWGPAKAADTSFVRSLRSPFRPAAEKNYKGFDQGELFIQAWSNAEGTNAHKPGVVDLHNRPIIVPTDVWAGQLARATVRPFAYDSNGNKGVSLALEHVQIIKQDMPRLDGKQSADTAFAQADNSQLAALGIDLGATQGAGGGLDDLPF
jgi:hypothetical protein